MSSSVLCANCNFPHIEERELLNKSSIQTFPSESLISDIKCHDAAEKLPKELENWLGS